MKMIDNILSIVDFKKNCTTFLVLSCVKDEWVIIRSESVWKFSIFFLVACFAPHMQE